MSPWDSVAAIVLGGSNTDLVCSGAPAASPGEMVGGRRFTIGPGGKSRNVAQMMGTYLGAGRAAFVGRTLAPAADFAALDRLFAGDLAGADIMPYVYSLLAQVPVVALRRAGVVTEWMKQVPFAGTAAGTAEIVVLASGENMIYSVAGVNAEFSAADVEAAAPAFEAAGRRASGGVLALALEIPFDTALRGAELAREHGLRVILDPGGITKSETLNRGRPVPLEELLRLVDVVKPNEHEAKILTGVEVTDEVSAARAARVLEEKYGVADTVITAGSRGAWHVAAGTLTTHPAYRPPKVVDTTGCGDQFMAVLASHLATEPGDVAAGLAHAMVAGALQAGRPGIEPVGRDDVEEHLLRYRKRAAR